MGPARSWVWCLLGALVGCGPGVEFVPLLGAEDTRTFVLFSKDARRLVVFDALPLRGPALEGLEPPLELMLYRETPERLGLSLGDVELLTRDKPGRQLPTPSEYRRWSGGGGFEPSSASPEAIAAWIAPIDWESVVKSGSCTAPSRDAAWEFVIEPRCPGFDEPTSPAWPALPDPCAGEACCPAGWARVTESRSTDVRYPLSYPAPTHTRTATLSRCVPAVTDTCAPELRLPMGCLSEAPCPPFPSTLSSTAAIFVQSGAPPGGDGAPERPFDTVARALERDPSRALALGPGAYTSSAEALRGRRLVGACRAGVSLTLTGTQLQDVSLRELTVSLSSSLELRGAVRLDAVRARGALVRVVGALDARDAILGDVEVGSAARLVADRTHLEGALVVDGSATITRSWLARLGGRGGRVQLAASVLVAGSRLEGGTLDAEDCLWRASGRVDALSATDTALTLRRVTLTSTDTTSDTATAALSLAGAATLRASDLSILRPVCSVLEDPPRTGRGLALDDRATATVTRLFVDGACTYGVVVREQATLALSDATLLNPGRSGAMINGRATLDRVHVSGADRHGLSIESGLLTFHDLRVTWNREVALQIADGAGVEGTRMDAAGLGDGAVLVDYRSRLQLLDFRARAVSRSSCLGTCANAVDTRNDATTTLIRFRISDAKRAIRVFRGSNTSLRDGRIDALTGFVSDRGDDALEDPAPLLDNVRVETVGSVFATMVVDGP